MYLNKMQINNARRTLIIIVMAIGFLSWLTGCKNKKAASAREDVKLEEILSASSAEEGFKDAKLKITGETKNDSVHTYIAEGLHEGKLLGLKFEVKSKLEGGMSDKGEVSGNGFAANGLRMISTGTESDEFVRAMSVLYGHPTKKSFSKRPVTATVFSLNSGTADLDKAGLYQFKLFFENGKEDMPQELFFNIDTEKGIIYLPEKDEEFRQGLIDVWTR
jgi:hypothetical protein